MECRCLRFERSENEGFVWICKAIVSRLFRSDSVWWLSFKYKFYHVFLLQCSSQKPPDSLFIQLQKISNPKSIKLLIQLSSPNHFLSIFFTQPTCLFVPGFSPVTKPCNWIWRRPWRARRARSITISVRIWPGTRILRTGTGTFFFGCLFPGGFLGEKYCVLFSSETSTRKKRVLLRSIQVNDGEQEHDQNNMKEKHEKKKTDNIKQKHESKTINKHWSKQKNTRPSSCFWTRGVDWRSHTAIGLRGGLHRLDMDLFGCFSRVTGTIECLFVNRDVNLI